MSDESRPQTGDTLRDRLLDDARVLRAELALQPRPGKYFIKLSPITVGAIMERLEQAAAALAALPPEPQEEV